MGNAAGPKGFGDNGNPYPQPQSETAPSDWLLSEVLDAITITGLWNIKEPAVLLE